MASFSKRPSLLRQPTRGVFAAAILIAVLVGTMGFVSAQVPTFAQVVRGVQPKIVKIYGAGGIRGLEAYQSGFFISAEGHILTVRSYVLDTDFITVIGNNGRKFQAKVVGTDPRLEIAVLKVEATDLEHFNIDGAVEVDGGDRVLAFSNLYGVATGNEPASVQHGVVTAKTKLSARRGAYKTPYRGDVYVLDAMTNNPGAAGGALTDRRGRLVGILGKELRNDLNSTWLNFSMPMQAIAQAIDDIRNGKVRPLSKSDQLTRKRPTTPHTIRSLGLTLVPNILPKTPPFIDRVTRDSPAEKAGLKTDDLILYVNDRVTESCQTFLSELEFVDRIDSVKLLVQRKQELIELVLKPRDE